MTRPHPDLDIATQAIWHRAAEPLLRALWADPRLRLLEKLDTKNQALRRFPDAAALVRSAYGRLISHVEFEARPDPVRVARRVHTYGNLLFGLYDGRYPVRSTVVVLGGKREIPEIHEVTIGEQVVSTYRFQVWRLDRVSAGILATDPALAALAPLASDAEESHLLAALRCVRKSWPDEARAEILAALYITGSRRYGLELVRKLIHKEDLMLSPGYLDIFNDGLAKGLERGLERGTARARVLFAQMVGLRFGDSTVVDDLLPTLSADDIEALADLLPQLGSPEALRAAARERLRARHG